MRCEREEKTGSSVIELVKRNTLKLFGHVERMQNDWLTMKYISVSEKDLKRGEDSLHPEREK